MNTKALFDKTIYSKFFTVMNFIIQFILKDITVINEKENY